MYVFVCFYVYLTPVTTVAAKEIPQHTSCVFKINREVGIIET